MRQSTNKGQMGSTNQTGNTMFKGMKTGEMSSMVDTYYKNQSREVDEEELARIQARKIGPFAFDIDDDIDTEILTNQQVYDDLKELEDILDQGTDMNVQAN